MAPSPNAMRHRHETRLKRGPRGHAMAPRSSDSDAVPGYGTGLGSGQLRGGSSYDDGYYHPESYHSGRNGKQSADDGHYHSSQQVSSQRDSSADTANTGAYQQSQQSHGQANQQAQHSQHSQANQQNQQGQHGQSNQQSQQNSGSYGHGQQQGDQNTGAYAQAQGHQGNQDFSAYAQSQNNHSNAASQQGHSQAQNDGSYRADQNSAEQQQVSHDTQAENEYQQKNTPESNQQSQAHQQSDHSQQDSSHQNSQADSTYYQNQAYDADTAQQNKQANAYSHNKQQNDQDSAHQSQRPDDVNDLSHLQQVPHDTRPTDTLPTLPTLLPTSTSSETTSDPTTTTTITSLPSSSSASSASPSSTGESDSKGMSSYHAATAALGAVLAVVVIAGALLAWLQKRKRQQKPAVPMPSSEKLQGLGGKFSNRMSNTKKRASNIYASFIGTAHGTNGSALGAVRQSLKAPWPVSNQNAQSNTHHEESGHSSHNTSGKTSPTNEAEHSDSSDYIEKGNVNQSTPTLVVSPTDDNGRDHTTATVRRVPSGRPQMERMDSIDNRAGFSASAPETDGDQTERAAENCPNNNSSGNLSNRPGQSLLAITSMVPSSTSLYKVEIEFPAKKVGQLDLREGEYVTIRQSFDDGWVGCHLMLFISFVTNDIRFSAQQRTTAGKALLPERACLHGPPNPKTPPTSRATAHELRTAHPALLDSTRTSSGVFREFLSQRTFLMAGTVQCFAKLSFV